MIESVGLAFDYVRRLLAVVATDLLNRYSDPISPLSVYLLLSCYCAVTALTRVWQVFASIDCVLLVIEEGVSARHQRRHYGGLMERTTDSLLPPLSLLLTIRPVLHARVYFVLRVLLSVHRITRTRSHRPSTAAHSIRSDRESRRLWDLLHRSSREAVWVRGGAYSIIGSMLFRTSHKPGRTVPAACGRGEDIQGFGGVCMSVGACRGEIIAAERNRPPSLLDRNWKSDHRIVLGIVSD
jgi:hypothetical protein